MNFKYIIAYILSLINDSFKFISVSKHAEFLKKYVYTLVNIFKVMIAISHFSNCDIARYCPCMTFPTNIVSV